MQSTTRTKAEVSGTSFECFVNSKGVILDQDSRKPINLARICNKRQKVTDHFPFMHISDLSKK
ncbi:hypothetical protein GCM10028807_31760 [Spirosoma daeguense]